MNAPRGDPPAPEGAVPPDRDTLRRRWEILLGELTHHPRLHGAAACFAANGILTVLGFEIVALSWHPEFWAGFPALFGFWLLHTHGVAVHPAWSPSHRRVSSLPAPGGEGIPFPIQFLEPEGEGLFSIREPMMGWARLGDRDLRIDAHHPGPVLPAALLSFSIPVVFLLLVFLEPRVIGPFAFAWGASVYFLHNAPAAWDRRVSLRIPLEHITAGTVVWEGLRLDLAPGPWAESLTLRMSAARAGHMKRVLEERLPKG